MLRKLLFVVASSGTIILCYFLYALWPLLGGQVESALPPRFSNVAFTREIAEVFALFGVVFLPLVFFVVHWFLSKWLSRRAMLILSWLIPVAVFFPYFRICSLHPEGLNKLFGLISFAVAALCFYAGLLYLTLQYFGRKQGPREDD